MKKLILFSILVISQSVFADVCGRTSQVTTYFETWLEKTCSQVTNEDLKSFTKLSLQACNLENLQKEDLQGLINLETLNLRFNKLQSISEEAFQAIPNLKH